MNEPATLSKQLEQLRRTRYAQVPRLRYVMQAFLASSKHSESNRSEARTRVLDWARGKWPGLVPPHAYEGKAFEHDQAGLRIAATSNVDGIYRRISAQGRHRHPATEGLENKN
jgi:hypothetical protein